MQSNKSHGKTIDYSEVKLTDKMYSKFTEKMYELSGVNLPSSSKNHTLVQSRLSKVLRKHSFGTYDQYWDFLASGHESAVTEFVSALTTNMTSFFREPHHFEFFTKILPTLPEKFGRDIRVWCAASSTGAEPYTIGIVIKEAQVSTRVRVLATDIDLEVLKYAADGIYTEKELDGLSVGLKKKYFEPIKKADGYNWKAKSLLTEFIRFAPFNLVDKKYDFKFDFHVIFCRNVLIYFDEKTQKKVINNMVDILAPGGYLIIGQSESGTVKHPKLTALGGATYQKIE
jgi:chemotaxis protein methyltransferase CheR